MTFNIAADDPTKRTDEIVDLRSKESARDSKIRQDLESFEVETHLSRVGASDGVGDTNTVDSNLVDRSVDAQEVDQIGSERIFGRESDFNSLGLDEFDDFDGGLDDVGNVLSMRELSEERRSTNNDVDSINTCAFPLSKRPTGSHNEDAPVSTAMRASSMWHRMWVRILDLSPMLQILMQSSRDCSEAAGEVSSMYSTPKSLNAWAIRHLVSVSKNAFAIGRESVSLDANELSLGEAYRIVHLSWRGRSERSGEGGASCGKRDEMETNQVSNGPKGGGTRANLLGESTR